VPQIRLRVQDEGGRTLPASGGRTAYLPQYRLRAWVRVGSELLPRHAIIDTGAPAGIFSYQVWSTFQTRGDITWVAHPPTETDRTALPRIDVHGGNYPFRLGRIRLELADLDKGRLTSRDAMVICTEDVPLTPSGSPPQLPRLLILGLVDVMNGRSLLLQASADGRQWTAVLSEP
jgi:hypothetical protein